jgi:hypothetical protein
MNDLHALVNGIITALPPDDGTPGSELSERNRDAEDERRIAAALTGKVTDWQSRNGDRYRSVVERRVAACPRVAGCTYPNLKREQPEQYRRFLRGCTRAVRREAALADGSLSLGELAELRRRFKNQVDMDRIVEEFPDFEDRSEEWHP